MSRHPVDLAVSPIPTGQGKFLLLSRPHEKPCRTTPKIVRAQTSKIRSGAFQESTTPQKSVWAFHQTRGERRGALRSFFRASLTAHRLCREPGTMRMEYGEEEESAAHLFIPASAAARFHLPAGGDDDEMARRHGVRSNRAAPRSTQTRGETERTEIFNGLVFKFPQVGLPRFRTKPIKLRSPIIRFSLSTLVPPGPSSLWIFFSFSPFSFFFFFHIFCLYFLFLDNA